jgi:cobalt-zinc-cadmium efflux system protein
LFAQANRLTLLLLAVWLADEAIRRLIYPPNVTGSYVLVSTLSGSS